MGKQRIAEGSSRDSQRKPIPPKRIYYVYETVAKIISKALNQEGTLRSLVYEHAKTLLKTHLRLSIEVVRHRNLLERLVTETGLAEKEGLEPILAQVLVYELVLGERKTLPSDLEIFDRVTEHHHALKKALKKIRTSGDIEKLVVDKPEATVPRYGRINTLVASLESVVENLQRRGFTLVDTEGKSYQEFLDCVSQLEEKQFVLDFHFPRDLLVFNPSQLLANLFVYKAGHLVVQDKTSYFPVACLAPPPGSVVLDACAAPGMKTIHIAAKMKNEGMLYAIDINTKNLQRMESNLDTHGVQCCQSSYANFLSVNPKQEPFRSAEYILLDVPCSHTGNRSTTMQSAGVNNIYTPQRLKSLSALQYKMLSHALKFPKVKRIVYTTTSIEEQENENVIQDVLSKNPEKFKLARGFPEWHVRGSPDFQFGEFCVRAQPNEDHTIGFFMAVLDRIKDGPEQVESFSMRSTDIIGKLPLEPFVDRVGNRRDEKQSTFQKNQTEMEDTDEHDSEGSSGDDTKEIVKTKKDKQSTFQKKKTEMEDIDEHDSEGSSGDDTKEIVKTKKDKFGHQSRQSKKHKAKRMKSNSEGENLSGSAQKANREHKKRLHSESDLQDDKNMFFKSVGKSSKNKKGMWKDMEYSEIEDENTVAENEKWKKQISESKLVDTPKPKVMNKKKKKKSMTAVDVGGINIFTTPRK